MPLISTARAGMEKSTHTREYRVFLATLRAAREGAAVTQIDLASRISQSQSFVSKCERGETRIDLVQLRVICSALGITLSNFVRRFEANLRAERR